MKLLRNLIGCVIVSLMIAVGFRGIDIISSSYASNFSLAKQNAFLRSVKIETMNSSWSGLIYQKSQESGFLVLTIIHEESMNEMRSSGFPYMMVTMESGEKHFAKVIAWDRCNEVAMIQLVENDKRYIPRVKINTKELNYSTQLFSWGHPLGGDLRYSEGIMSSKNTMIKDCGASTDGFSGGISPGQTGSGVYDNDGRLTGLVIATSAYRLYSQNQSGETVSIGSMPIDGLGLYLPSDTIVSFLKLNHLY